MLISVIYQNGADIIVSLHAMYKKLFEKMLRKLHDDRERCAVLALCFMPENWMTK